MIWNETHNANGYIYYNKCQVCDRYPAMTLRGQAFTGYEEESHGPFCRQHWLDEVQKVFSELDRRLDNEDY